VSHLYRTSVLSVSLVLCLVVLCASAEASTLSGRITDPDGRAVERARVVVSTEVGTMADRSTDREGRFDIPALPAGTYHIRFVADGFEADPVDVTLDAETPRTLDVMLRVSAVAESVLVSASQIDLPLSRAADSVSVLTAGDLQARQIVSVADALRLVPDMAVTQTGDRGALTSLFPRGGASNYTLVLIDGVRANMFGGGYDFGHLSVADIDRIEVVRGPQSALYGSDAIGAVVQIVTRRGGPTGGAASIEAGGQKYERATAAASGSSGRWTWGGSAEQSRTDGYTGIAPATGEHVTNDDDHMRRASGSLEWQQPGGAGVLFSGNIGHDERGNPGPFGSNPVGNFTAVDRTSRGINDTRQAGVRITYPTSPRARTRIDANIFDLASDFAGTFPATSGTRRIDGRLQEDVALNSSLGLSAGVELLRERGRSSYVVGAAGQEIPIERTALGPFAELRYAAGDRLFVTAGARVDRLTRDSLEADPVGGRPAFDAQSINSFNPKLAVSYRIGSSANGASTRLHASAGSGIRPPDAFEIAYTDNPHLKPERSRSIDAGVEQRLAGDSVVLGLTAFFNRYDDLLVTVGHTFASASQYRTDNISNARARGLELSADVRPIRPLTVRANYTLLDTEILSIDGLQNIAPIDAQIVPSARQFAVGDMLLRRPRHQGSIDITYVVGRVTAFGDIIARSQVLDVEPSYGAFGGLFYSAGYAVANLGATVRVTPNVEVYGRVLNATDRAYEEAFGFPAQRRTVIGGLRVALSR
jgi:outer membrane cobalamin receptor